MSWPRLQAQMTEARALGARHGDRVEWASSFNLTNWHEPDWQRSALETVATSFAEGAVAVKIWKEVGMELRDPDGRYVMIDNARFGRILALVERRHRTLVAHLGEPRNCWLPLEEMTTDSDRILHAIPDHASLHKEIPGYEEQLAARDRMIERHPDSKSCSATWRASNTTSIYSPPGSIGIPPPPSTSRDGSSTCRCSRVTGFARS